MLRVCIAASLFIVGTASAHAADYQFQTIATSTDFFLGDRPQIDATGAVYFEAVPRSQFNHTQIIRGTPSTLTPIVEVGGPFQDISFQSASSSGEVAFWTNTTAGESIQLYRTNSGAFDHVVYPSSDFSLGNTSTSRAWINSDGTVAYLGQLHPSTGSPYVLATSLSTTPLISAGPGQPFNGISDGGEVTNGAFPGTVALNNQGDVAFWGENATVGFGLFNVGQDGTVTTLFNEADIASQFFGVSNVLDMNDSGTVAIGGLLTDVETAAIYTLHDGNLTLVADSSGAYSPDLFTVWDINNKNEFAFQTTLDDGRPGIFTGSDPIADKVIMQGDPLAGSTVAGLSFHRGLNDAGQIAFWAQLADGRTGIFRADPIAIPEPATFVLAGIGSLALLAYKVRYRRQRRV